MRRGRGGRRWRGGAERAWMGSTRHQSQSQRTHSTQGGTDAPILRSARSAGEEDDAAAPVAPRYDVVPSRSTPTLSIAPHTRLETRRILIWVVEEESERRATTTTTTRRGRGRPPLAGLARAR